jgi:hypothetical protein
VALDADTDTTKSQDLLISPSRGLGVASRFVGSIDDLADREYCARADQRDQARGVHGAQAVRPLFLIPYLGRTDPAIVNESWAPRGLARSPSTNLRKAQWNG